MTNTFIQSALNGLLKNYNAASTLEDTKEILTEAQNVVRAIYKRELNLKDGQSLEQVASENPEALHRITEEQFGFRPSQQPKYGAIDDHAWEYAAQSYSTLEGVTLPRNATFFDSARRKLSREAVDKKMETGEFRLFDIALSDEYVLLGANEKFSVRDIEQKFNTNNEHMPPQSMARVEGRNKVFKQDPRAIVISDTKRNSDRGNLQVILSDEGRNASAAYMPEQKQGQYVSPRRAQTSGALTARGTVDRNNRYKVPAEDAAHYAYALGLAHFADGFNQEGKNYWFDTKQAQEVLKTLDRCSEKTVVENPEYVMRDIVSDAKQLGGNINPVALMPEVFAAALRTEISQNKFHGAPARRETEAKPASFAERLRQEEKAPQVGVSRA